MEQGNVEERRGDTFRGQDSLLHFSCSMAVFNKVDGGRKQVPVAVRWQGVTRLALMSVLPAANTKLPSTTGKRTMDKTLQWGCCY